MNFRWGARGHYKEIELEIKFKTEGRQKRNRFHSSWPPRAEPVPGGEAGQEEREIDKPTNWVNNANSSIEKESRWNWNPFQTLRLESLGSLGEQWDYSLDQPVTSERRKNSVPVLDRAGIEPTGKGRDEGGTGQEMGADLSEPCLVLFRCCSGAAQKKVAVGYGDCQSVRRTETWIPETGRVTQRSSGLSARPF